MVSKTRHRNANLGPTDHTHLSVQLGNQFAGRSTGTVTAHMSGLGWAGQQTSLAVVLADDVRVCARNVPARPDNHKYRIFDGVGS